MYVCNDAVSAVYGLCKIYAYDVATGEETPFTEFFCRASANSSKEFPLEGSKEFLASLTPSQIILCDLSSPYGSDRAMFVPGRFADLPIIYSEPVVTENGGFNDI